jgi:hypothetical protein
MDFIVSRTLDENFNGVIRFNGEVRYDDILCLKLDKLERSCLNDILSDAKASSADHLLLLEMLFRRYEEQMSKTKD